MTEKEISEYLKELILKYDYYDPFKDRIEVFKFSNIKSKKILVLECIDELTSVILVNNFKCTVRTICDSEEKIKKIKQKLEDNNIKIDSEKLEISFVPDFFKIPFEDNFFDVVVSFNTIHHRRNILERLIEEIFRVSKNKVIISELNKSGAKIFDECISPEENHECLIIDHDTLKRNLEVRSKVRLFKRKLITTYVCKKKTRIEENKMSEEFWLKYGFKENGELICERMLTKSKPASEFFYTDNGECKEVMNSNVLKITKDSIDLLNKN